MSRSIAAQPHVFAAYYLPMCGSQAESHQAAGRARLAFRRLRALLARHV